MTTLFSDLMRALSPQGEVFSVAIPPDWMQGRTTYGGLSAALCLEGVRRSFAGLPALRSAQISFIGPVGGEVAVAPVLLRQGKSVTFAGADLSGEQGLATRAVFAFGAARPSAFDGAFIPAPDMPAPEACELYAPEGKGPLFARQYEVRLAKGARPLSGSPVHDTCLWVRHKDQRADDIVALLALADLPPPAVAPMFERPAPISSVTWMLNFLHAELHTDDGWWLLQSRAENAAEGYSSQDMLAWNRKGEPVIAGRQSVAIFI